MITFLRLIRAPNIVTSISNVCAGAFILASLQLTFPPLLNLIKLMICSGLLYAVGIIWNDLFDLEIDRVRRPKRPLPSGAFSVKKAVLTSACFSLVSLAIAATISISATLICLAIMLCAYLYDSWAKHNDLLGSLFMGLCRGLNLALGFCAFSEFSFHQNDPYINTILYFAAFHLVYIFTVTYIGTMQEGDIPLEKLFVSFALVTVLIIYVFLLPDEMYFTTKFLLILLLAGGYYRLQKIYKFHNPKDVGLTVKYSILSLIPIDAMFAITGATGFVAFIPAIAMILFLFPISYLLAKAIEMT